MTIQNVVTEEDTFHFLENYGDSRAKRELIALLGRHPNTKFNGLALCHASDCTKLDIDRALQEMLAAGLVDTCNLNGTTLYSLTTKDEIHCMIIKLGNIGWDQLQLIVRRLEGKA